MTAPCYQTCEVTGQRFIIPEGEIDLLRRSAQALPHLREQAFPLPLSAPAVALREMFSWGNLLNLYKSESALSRTPQISRYNPAFGYKICTLDEFWDRVENTEFGAAYDFSRPFFDQFSELLHRVYLQPLGLTHSEDSSFVNGGSRMRRCYLCFATSESEDCMYCHTHYYGHDNVDCIGATKCQFCYSCSDVEGCYECQHCGDCWNCVSCVASVDCRGCSNCAGCVGLNNQSFHLFNKAYTKEKYFEALANAGLGSFKARLKFLSEAERFIRSECHRINRIINSENTTGSYILNSQNLHQCYHTSQSRDCGYLVTGMNSNDCWKGYSVRCELQYAGVNYGSYGCPYTYAIFDCERVMYSYLLFNHCAECFGCAALKKASYCILNKQYTKSEYADLLPRIVAHMKETGEWGKFFPPRHSPHSYEENWGFELMEDIPEEEQKRRGYRMEKIPAHKAPSDAVTAAQIPDSIEDADEAILTGRVIQCAETGEPFNIQRKEFAFYRKMDIPIPRVHWRRRLRRLVEKRDRVPEGLDLIDPEGVTPNVAQT